MASVLLFIAVLAVCGLMLWGSYKLEPHWVSKDGERLVCYGQGIDRQGNTLGRWREVRVTKIRADTVEVRPRHGSLVVDKYAGGAGGIAGGLMKRRGQKASYWNVSGASDAAPRKRAVYLLQGCNDPDLPFMFALRVPSNSRAITMLEDLSVNKRKPAAAANDRAASDRAAVSSDATEPASPPSPGTPRSAEQPDPG